MSHPYPHSDSQLEIAPPSAIELLWINHRGLLLGSVAALVVLVAIALGVMASMSAAQTASENLLASATNDAGWNEVMTKYPHTPAAADAMLLLAASLREQGKYQESDEVCSRFAETYPTSMLSISGLLGRAANACVNNHPDKALSYYQEAAAESPASYGAPFALYAQARLLIRLGKMEDAKRVVQTLLTQYPGSASSIAFGGAQPTEQSPQSQ